MPFTDFGDLRDVSLFTAGGAGANNTYSVMVSGSGAYKLV